MSKSEPDKRHRTTTGVSSKYADVASDDHALKSRFGSDEEAKKIEFEAKVIGKRVAEWYDDPAAAIREYLSNAETACIRRAKQELVEEGWEVPEEVSELLELASEKCEYHPVIEVTYNCKPESTKLVIEDNGIGISTDEYLVLKKIGYSTSHMDGERLGQFGMGYLSGFQLVGTEGVFNMSTRSFLTEETYSTANYITNFEYLDKTKETYGTRFEFPSFCDKACSIRVRGRVEEYSEGMRVPVLYREMDNTGKEVFNEDYTPTDLSEYYSEEDFVIEYENRFFEATMSVNWPKNSDCKTFNISMPIRRNTGSYGKNPSFNAPWKWDFRGKEENGPIVSSDNESIVGLSPVSDSEYENLSEEQKDSFIRRSDVPEDAIVMPTPASSRDSYERGHDDFWGHVSNCLLEEWKKVVAETIDSLTDFNEFKDLSIREKKIIVRGYQWFGPKYRDNDVEEIIESLKESLDITVSEEMARKLDELYNTILVVERGASNPSYKTYTSKEKVWELIDCDGEVYMGKTISDKKAEIAWDLDEDNVVVRLEDESYERLEELWGWKKLKDLPSQNLEEKLPELSDSLAEKWESTSSSDSNSGNRRTSRNPASKQIKVYSRKKTSGKSFSTMYAGDVFDHLDNSREFSAGYGTVSKLIIFDKNERSVKYAKKHINKGGRVGVTTVPKYVYEYLIEADNVYTSEDELRKDVRESITVELSGDREVSISEIPEDELILLDADILERRFEDSLDTLREWFEEKTGKSFGNVSFVDSEKFIQYQLTSPHSGTFFHFAHYNKPGTRFRVNGRRESQDDIVEELLVPDNIDWGHGVMEIIKKGGYSSSDKKMEVVNYLKEHDALPTE